MHRRAGARVPPAARPLRAAQCTGTDREEHAMQERHHRVLRFIADPGKLVGMAGVCVLAGLFAGYVSLHDTADRLLALRQGPPQPVTVEAFRAGVHMGPAREVTVQGRADPHAPLAFQVERDGSVRTLVAVPLMPTGAGDADDGAGTVPAFVLVDVTARGARPEMPRYLTPVPADGMDGVHQITGQSISDAAATEALAAALAERGLSLAGDPLIVRPYPQGREAALRPGDAPHTWWHGFLWAAGLLIGAAIWQAGKGDLPRPDHVRLYEAERRAWGERHRSGAARTNPFAPLSSQDEVDGDGTGLAACGAGWRALFARFQRPSPASEFHADARQP
jgi:hypothetical protein